MLFFFGCDNIKMAGVTSPFSLNSDEKFQVMMSHEHRVGAREYMGQAVLGFGGYAFGPPGSESGSIKQRSGSFLFLNSACKKQDFNTKFLAKINFLRLKIMCQWLSYKKKIWGKNYFFSILKVTEKRSWIRIH
jgi:hypothetical protein